MSDYSSQTQPLSASYPVDSAEDMQALGQALAGQVQGGDVIVLSGPLGAGKTTFSQGFGRGLSIPEPIVSPTFTIARELSGLTAAGQPIRLIHVDAYRLGSLEFVPGENRVEALLDELESLGLDEELEAPGQSTVVLMEWGRQMAASLASQRLEIAISRPLPNMGSQEPTMSSQGRRIVTMQAIGPSWQQRFEQIQKVMEA